jgi:RNA-directed DNA polymerase
MRTGSHTFTAYRQKLLSKGAGKHPRVISIATARDRIVLKSIAHFLRDVFPESTTRTAQESVDLVKVAMQNGPFDGYVRIDIQNFYPTVDHELLMARLRTRIRKRQPLALIESAIKNPTVADGISRGTHLSPRGVAQGLAISNSLAEISMAGLDDVFTSRPDIYYVRYVDDVLIMCARGQCESIFNEATACCESLNLVVHPLAKGGGKSSIGELASRFEFLGYLFDNGKVSVREDSIRRVDASIASVLTRFKRTVARRPLDKSHRAAALAECEWKLNLIVTGCTFQDSRRGWVAYFSQISDLSVLKRLDAALVRNVARFGLTGQLSTKSFMRTYWRIKNPGGRYIPNFDKYSVDEKRAILVSILNIEDAAKFTAKEVERTFRTRISRFVKELDRHIGSPS